MSVYAIADTHLSFGTNKPMDDFYGWDNYVERLKNNWEKLIEPSDTVVIAGDISWAMDFNELHKDFEFLNSLPGNKIIIKGNHDFWWNTKKKMDLFIKENNFSSIRILHNDAVEVDNIIVCGSRGWFFDDNSENDKKVLNREVQRIKTSIEYIQDTDKEKIVFLHYPPITANSKCSEIIDLLENEGIRKCYYGHLHGMATNYAVEENVDNISYRLISADKLAFMPYFISK